MKYQIISHSFENTGGNCMVSIFEVKLNNEEESKYCSVNEELVTLTTIDFIHTLEVDDYDEITIATESIDELNESGEYFELFSYCIREYLIASLKQEFFQQYKDQYDYLYHNLDRGLTLATFINSKATDYKWMFTTEKPNTFYDIPEAIRDDYKNYMLEVLHRMYGHTGDYSLNDALESFNYTNH